MTASDFSLGLLPAWYRAERDTANTIDKLSDIKELGYYLKNPDEYVRRLAILRLQKFSAKESVNTLKEVLDDGLESQANKYLAAWVLKSLAVKWNFDIFVTSRYLTKFSGTESYDELFGVKPETEVPSIRFDFSASLSRSAFKLEEEVIARTEDIRFDTEFDFRQWFSTLGPRLLKKAGSTLASIFLKLPGRVHKKPGITAAIKKGLFNMLYLLFFPLRFALKHKLAVICSLAAIYILFAFTDYGRAFTNKYMGIDLKDVQKKAIDSVKYYTGYALNEFNRLTGIDEWKENEAKKQQNTTMPASTADNKIYLVTAEKGLNIRESPDAASAKVGSNPLPYGSTVTYLLKTENDSSGKPWYYVKASDGRTGWVSAKFLKEKKEG